MAFKDHFATVGTDQQKAWVADAVGSKFSAQHIRLSRTVPVEFVNLQNFSGLVHPDELHFHPPTGYREAAHGIATAAGPAGLFWWGWDGAGNVTMAKIQIEQTLPEGSAKSVVVAECAHAIDILSPDWSDEKRGRMFDAYHSLPAGSTGPIRWSFTGNASTHGHGWFGPQSYFDTPGESFMIAVIRAFTPFPHGDWWAHQSNPAVVATLRELLSSAPPTTPPPPVPKPWALTVRGWVTKGGLAKAELSWQPTEAGYGNLNVAVWRADNGAASRRVYTTANDGKFTQNLGVRRGRFDYQLKDGTGRTSNMAVVTV